MIIYAIILIFDIPMRAYKTYPRNYNIARSDRTFSMNIFNAFAATDGRSRGTAPKRRYIDNVVFVILTSA